MLIAKLTGDLANEGTLHGNCESNAVKSSSGCKENIFWALGCKGVFSVEFSGLEMTGFNVVEVERIGNELNMLGTEETGKVGIKGVVLAEYVSTGDKTSGNGTMCEGIPEVGIMLALEDVVVCSNDEDVKLISCGS